MAFDDLGYFDPGFAAGQSFVPAGGDTITGGAGDPLSFGSPDILGGAYYAPGQSSLYNPGGTAGFPAALSPAPEQDYVQRLMSFFTPEPAQPGQASNLDRAALALPAIGALGGLAGIFQQMSQGRSMIKQTTQRGPASPQEQALLAQTLSQLSQMQGLAHNAELQQAISRLAAGQLPISSNLVDQVTKAFSSVAANTAEQAIEGARERGFAGGTELLGGAGSPQYGRQMAQVQSDVSRALVDLALGLPVTASNIQAQQMGAQMQPVQGGINLLGQLGAQAPQTTTQQGPAPSLLQSMGPFANVLGGLGGALGGYAAATRPSSGQDQFYRALANQISMSGAPGAPTASGGGL